jgi:hypothetical protein
VIDNRALCMSIMCLTLTNFFTTAIASYSCVYHGLRQHTAATICRCLHSGLNDHHVAWLTSDQTTPRVTRLLLTVRYHHAAQADAATAGARVCTPHPLYARSSAWLACRYCRRHEWRHFLAARHHSSMGGVALSS